ncbi:MAG: TlpA disulfide reductase family protein [Burkholderiales bacterium]
MNRRLALLGGAAAAAGAAGAGVASWRTRVNAADDAATIWPMRFETPTGGQLSFADLRGKPLLLNFWATWCPPCISELPLLDQFHREHQARGWQVVGLAVDNRVPVSEFLGKRPVGFAIGLAGLEGVDLARTMGNTAGALPFTVVFDRAGGVKERKLGAIQSADLTRWLASVA